jgi:hypothetical protein
MFQLFKSVWQNEVDVKLEFSILIIKLPSVEANFPCLFTTSFATLYSQSRLEMLDPSAILISHQSLVGHTKAMMYPSVYNVL